MSINLVTYANQTVTPTNDAIIYEKAVNQNGIFHGCNVTVSGNNVNITGGYGIVCGREFVIESESIPVTLAPSVTILGRLYVRLDLADADNPIQLLTAQGGTLPPLVQDSDVNYTNGTWEMELATFDVGVSALSNVVETYETIEGSVHDDGSGNVTLAGNITLENHASAIGWYDVHTNTTTLSNTTTFTKFSGSDITLSPGRFIITGSITFNGASSGYRGITIQDSGGPIGRATASQQAIPSSSWTTAMTTTIIYTTSTTTTVSLMGYQNSGASLGVDWRIYAMRIR